jgi:hypothetical protein
MVRASIQESRLNAVYGKHLALQDRNPECLGVKLERRADTGYRETTWSSCSNTAASLMRLRPTLRRRPEGSLTKHAFFRINSPRHVRRTPPEPCCSEVNRFSRAGWTPGPDRTGTRRHP